MEHVGRSEIHLPSGVIKHGVLETGQFIGDVPIKTSIYRGISIAMFDYLEGRLFRLVQDVQHWKLYTQLTWETRKSTC